MTASGLLSAPTSLAAKGTHGSRSGVLAPARIPGLALWLDAGNVDGAYNATLIDGQPVAQWTDLSGNAKHAIQGAANKRPLFRRANPNLIAYNDATFEGGIAGWNVNSNCTIARSTVAPIHGAASLAMASVAAGDMSSARFTICAAAPGKTYTITVAFAAAAAARSVAFGIAWRGTASTFDTAHFSDAGGVTITATVTAPAGTTGIDLYLNVFGTGAAAEVHYADKVGIYEGSALPGPGGTWLAPVTLPSGQRACVQFDYLDDTLQTPALGVAQPFTAFVVSRVDAMVAGVERAVLTWQPAARTLTSISAATHRAYVYDGATFTNYGPADDDNVWHDYEVVAAANNVTGYADGANPGAGSYTQSDATQSALLAASSLAALLIYTHALTAGERGTVESFLRQRFGTP